MTIGRYAPNVTNHQLGSPKYAPEGGRGAGRKDVLIWNHWIQRHSNRGFASTQEKITGANPGPKVTQNVNIDIGSPRLLVSSEIRNHVVAYWAGG